MMLTISQLPKQVCRAMPTLRDSCSQMMRRVETPSPRLRQLEPAVSQMTAVSQMKKDRHFAYPDGRGIFYRNLFSPKITG